MDARFLYPLESCKVIHLLRHGQALHNVEAEKDRNALLSPHLFDAPLTDHGHQQVENLREQLVSSGLLERVELVVTSPLFRTMQTAVGVFGNEYKQPSMKNSPPILALEVARDRNGVRPLDMRRNVSEYQTLFPTIDFSQMESEEDNLWRPDVRESEEDILARGLEFMKWLWKRPEKEVAVVSHGIVLQHMLYVFANDCDESIRHGLCKRFANCEIRTVVIVDKGFSSGELRSIRIEKSMQLNGTKQPILHCSHSNSKIPTWDTLSRLLHNHNHKHSHNQVFISFRGKDERYRFVSHLVDAFKRHGINCFIDKDEEKGKGRNHLFARIKQSRMALIIFSKRYAESRWCLNELAMIKKRADKHKLQAVPIFFKVKAESVRYQKDEFGRNFWRLAKTSSGEQIKKWKEALESVSDKIGLSLDDTSSEADFIEEIVKEVKRVIAV